MKKIKNNQTGFSALEIILIILLIGVLAGVGWYVWHSRTTNTASTAVQPALQTTKAATITPKPVDPYAGWQTVSTGDKDMSIKIPVSWIVTTCKPLDPSVLWISSSKSNAATCNAGNVGEVIFIWSTSAPDTSFHQYSNNLTSTDMTLNDVKGTKVSYTLSSDVPGAEAGSKGTKVIEYTFKRGNNYFTATYFQHLAGADDSTTFNKIVQSWKF